MKLNPAHITVPLPWVPQRANFDCGVAMVESVLAYAGRTAHDRKTLMAALRTHPERGTEAEEIAAVMQAARLPAKIVEELTRDDLEEAIEQKSVVLAAIQCYGAGHWVGVVGACSQYVYFRDPERETDDYGARGWRQWMRMWWDFNRSDVVVNGLAVVIKAARRKWWTARRM